MPRRQCARDPLIMERLFTRSALPVPKIWLPVRKYSREENLAQVGRKRREALGVWNVVFVTPDEVLCRRLRAFSIAREKFHDPALLSPSIITVGLCPP